MIDKDYSSYKTIGEVVKILGLKSKKKWRSPYTYFTILGKRV